MEVKILETKPILPSTPPFKDDHELPLSHLDNDHNMRVSFRYLRVYVSSTATDRHPYDVIANAISSALVHYYPLAATIRHAGNERLSVFCQVGQGLPLVNATVDSTLESLNYLDDPDSDFVEKLVPDPSPEEALVNPCILQVTVFKCGGYTLGAAIHFSLCDGLGATQFFNAVAELARGANQVTVQPVWDRLSLLGPRDPPRAAGPVREFLSLEKGFKPYRQEVGPVVRECFEVTDECLDRLKDVLFEKCGLKFTTFEALGAFLWRAKVRCSGVSGDQNVKYAYATNIRRTVKPPLPLGYWGNGCVPLYAQLSAKEVVEQPLWKTAEVIKKSKSNANDEYVRSFIDFQELHHGDGITAGTEVSGFTDWRHLGHSSVDFGWGGPVTVFPLSRHLLGSVEPCFFLPYSSANSGKKDGFKVQVTLRESAIAAFREEMKKFSKKDFGVSVQECYSSI
ncbi:Transferase [Melia azedarach]|uniref:Transferase n=1 Tax=Melia azedarach TaxID=155640 RepID=A0ACC1WXI3_MELAZ|nr:Transferase [Melia azedarach]